MSLPLSSRASQYFVLGLHHVDVKEESTPRSAEFSDLHDGEEEQFQLEWVRIILFLIFISMPCRTRLSGLFPLFFPSQWQNGDLVKTPPPHSEPTHLEASTQALLRKSRNPFHFLGPLHGSKAGL